MMFFMMLVRYCLMLVSLTGVLSHPLLSLHQSWNMDAASSITLMSYQSICSTSLIFLPNMSCCRRYMYIFWPFQWIGVVHGLHEIVFKMWSCTLHSSGCWRCDTNLVFKSWTKGEIKLGNYFNATLLLL